MAAVGQTVDAVLLVVFVASSWWAPRRFGLLGMFGSHLFVAAGVVAMIPIAMLTGIWQPGDYDGAMSICGCLFMAFALNCVLLPVAITAIVRRRNHPR